MTKQHASTNSRITFVGNRAGEAFLGVCIVVSIVLAYLGWWPLLPVVGALVGFVGIRGSYWRMAVAFPVGWLGILVFEALIGRHILGASTAISEIAGLGAGPEAPLVVTAFVAWFMPSVGFYFGRSMRGMAEAYLLARREAKAAAPGSAQPSAPPVTPQEPPAPQPTSAEPPVPSREAQVPPEEPPLPPSEQQAPPEEPLA